MQRERQGTYRLSQLKTEANKQGKRISTKRVNTQPAGQIDISKPDIELLNPKYFFEIVWFESLFKLKCYINTHRIFFPYID